MDPGSERVRLTLKLSISATADRRGLPATLRRRRTAEQYQWNPMAPSAPGPLTGASPNGHGTHLSDPPSRSSTGATTAAAPPVLATMPLRRPSIDPRRG